MSSIIEFIENSRITDIGILPKDWLLPSYDEVFDFLTTASYSRAQLSENDEISYVHYGDIHTKCIHFLDFDKVVLPTIKNELRKNYPFLKDGDVLIVDASEDYEGVGKSVEVRNIKNRKAISGLHTFLLRDKNESIANGFKGYIHSNKLVKKQMDTLATGLKVYGVSKANLKKIFIPLPPTKEEQTAIATALNDADELINSLEKLIAKKRMIKQGAMQELLKPKEGWVEKTLGELFEITSSKRVFQSDWKSSGVPFYRARELAVLSEIGKVENELFITNEMYESFRRHFGVPQIGDMLVTGVGTLGKVYVVPDEQKFYFKDGNIIWFKIDGKIDSEYLKQLYTTKMIKKQIEDASGKTTVGTYTITGAKKTLIFMPKTKEEQKYISQILSDMDIEIETLEKKLEKYKMLKQGMMQNLLTGKIRLV